MPETRYIEHGGIRTAYTDSGGDGMPLVLIHGYTGSKLDFRDEVAALAETRRVINIDLRGHGESTNTGDEDSYTLETLVADLDSVVELLDLDKLDILGHSLGGMVVMRYVVKRPKKVRSLILMDTHPGPMVAPVERPTAVDEQARKEGVQSLLPMMRSMPVSPGAQHGIDYLGEEEHYRRIETKLAQMDPAAFVGLMNGMREMRGFSPQLGGISCPATIIVGEEDEPFLEPSKDMAQVMAGSNLVIIPLAAHCPQYENAPAWREAIAMHFADIR